jgi:hypothetical protein
MVATACARLADARFLPSSIVFHPVGRSVCQEPYPSTAKTPMAWSRALATRLSKARVARLRLAARASLGPQVPLDFVSVRDPSPFHGRGLVDRDGPGDLNLETTHEHRTSRRQYRRRTRNP